MINDYFNLNNSFFLKFIKFFNEFLSILSKFDSFLTISLNIVIVLPLTRGLLISPFSKSLINLIISLENDFSFIQPKSPLLNLD